MANTSHSFNLAATECYRRIDQSLRVSLASLPIPLFHLTSLRSWKTKKHNSEQKLAVSEKHSIASDTTFLARTRLILTEHTPDTTTMFTESKHILCTSLLKFKL